MPYVNERWAGGMLTNFPTIRKAIKKMTNIDRLMNDGTFSNLSKREILQIFTPTCKVREKLRFYLRPYSFAFCSLCSRCYEEHIAVKEANRLGIPVFGIVDTNSDPKNIDYVIPANDDAKDSVEVILGACCAAIAEGLEERKIEKADEKAAAEQAEEAAEAKPKRAARKAAAEEAPTNEEEAPAAE